MNTVRKKRLLLATVPVLVCGGFFIYVLRVGHQNRLNQALIVAVKKNDAAKAIALLANGADSNARDIPVANADTSIWQKLLDTLKGRHLQPAHGPTALVIALDMDIYRKDSFLPQNVPLIRALINAGADVNVTDADGDTPLMLSAMASKKETIRLLLDKGADINARTSEGTTALYCAVPNMDVSIPQILVARGAMVNATGTRATSPLACAAFFGNIQTVQLLLVNGATVNVKNADGNTPLYDAVMGNHINCVRLLISKGADVNTSNNAGDTPLSWATQENEADIAELLKKAGALK